MKIRLSPSIILGFAVFVFGSVGIAAAVVMEIIYQEPIYLLMMKIFPWFMAVGGILIGIGKSRNHD